MGCLNGQQWLVVYTRPRGEKKLMTRLLDKGLEVYCPMQKTLRQWSDRKKMVTTPVFTSYLFVKVNDQERMLVLREPLAIRFLYWLGRPAVIREQDMQSLRHFLISYKKVQLETIEPKPGDQVAIIKGPFKGETALVMDVKGNKIRVCLTHIGIRLVAEMPVKETKIS